MMIQSSTHILHVDDEPEFGDLTATFLERENDRFTVETATSAADGLESIRDSPPDCIVSDYDMPGQDGIEFLQSVREEFPNLPFILFTGKGGEEVASEAISAGVTDYLQKGSGTEKYELLANRVENVVEKHVAEKEVDWHRTVIQNMNEGVYIFDKDYQFRFVDFRVRIDGMPEEEWIGRDLSFLVEEDVVSPSEAQRVREGVDRVFAGKTDEARVEIEPSLPTEAETTDIRFTLLHTETNEELVLGTTRDITEHKERERKLQDYEAVIEALEDPVYTLDEEGRFTYVNDAFTESVGYDRETILGNTPSLIKDEESVETAEQHLGRLLSDDGPETVTFEVEIHSKDGDPVVYEDHMGVLTYEGNDFDGSVGNLRDITEQKKRKKELERQNNRLEEFASIVSHDLRSPLSVAKGRIELAQQDCDSRHLDDVEEAHNRMEALIEDTLTLAREGNQASDRKPVELGGFVRECLENTETEEATVVVEDEVTIKAKKSSLKQLCENLIRNSVEHGHGEVAVVLGELDEKDGFYFADDGDGLSEGDREEVFERGYSTSEKGTGLGLSIVERIVEAHGWEIRATDSDGGGARFEITGVETVK